MVLRPLGLAIAEPFYTCAPILLAALTPPTWHGGGAECTEAEMHSLERTIKVERTADKCDEKRIKVMAARAKKRRHCSAAAAAVDRLIWLTGQTKKVS